MKYTKKEILDALKLIKDECESTATCRACPFRDEPGCAIRGANPHDWDLDDEDPETWRAFK